MVNLVLWPFPSHIEPDQVGSRPMHPVYSNLQIPLIIQSPSLPPLPPTRPLRSIWPPEPCDETSFGVVVYKCFQIGLGKHFGPPNLGWAEGGIMVGVSCQ